MTKKEKDLRKEKLKKSFFKWLHICCYILSALFILVLVISGVQSCNRKNNKVSNSSKLESPLMAFNVNNYPNVYKAKYDTRITIPYQDGTLISNNTVDCSVSYYVLQPDLTYELECLGTLYYNDGLEFNVTKFIFAYKCLYFQDTGSLCHYRLYNFNAYDSVTDSYINIVHKYNDLSSSEYYDVDYDTRIYRFVLTSDVVEDYGFNYFFLKQEIYNFRFNAQFNYNSPLGTNLQSGYGSGPSWTVEGGGFAYKDYDLGYFISNGQLFNKIRYRAMATGALHFYMKDNDGNYKIIQGPSGYYSYSMLEYINTDTGLDVTVNTRNSVAYQTSNGGFTYYQDNSSTWVNPNYQNLVFLMDLTVDEQNFLISFNNNNYGSYNGQIYSNGSDVFTLLSLGFTSLTAFLEINILPGISIGVLLFMPLIVGIVVILFHILKK